MKNLYLIDGASGTGKTDLLRYIAEFEIGGKTVPKLTTRDRREHETDEGPPLDLEWITEKEFDRRKPEYQYKYSGKRYGFTRAMLENALRTSDNVFAIVRNAKVIRQIMCDFDFINVVPVYIYTDKELVVARLRSENVPEDQIAFRLGRLTKAFEDYLKHPALYAEILINNSTYADYGRLIDGLVEKYSQAPEVEDDLVFVLMSFSEETPVLADYYGAIKRSVAAATPHLRCKRLDEEPGSYPISSTAKRKIQESRLAIVDLTGNRPNVFYELGFAHGMGKRCVLTAHKLTEPQFYPQEYNIIYYETATELEENLTRHLSDLVPQSRC